MVKFELFYIGIVNTITFIEKFFGQMPLVLWENSRIQCIAIARLNESRCDCLSMIKYLMFQSTSVPHVHSVNRNTRENIHRACKYDSNINICLRHWTTAMCRVNVRHTVPLFYMNTMSGRPRLFSHIEHVYHITSFAFPQMGRVCHLLLSPGISGLFETNSISHNKHPSIY